MRQFTDHHLFDHNPASNELDWMLQSSEIDNPTLLQALVSRYYSHLYRLSAFVLGDSALGMDAAQQTLLTVVSNRHRFWGNASLIAWIDGLALKTCQETLQRTGLTPETLPPGLDHELVDALQGLNKDQKLALFLRFGLDLPAPDIAYLLHKNLRDTLSLLRSVEDRIQTQLDRVDMGTPPAQPSETHPHFLALIHLNADGELDRDQKASLRQHLETCSLCRAASDRLAVLTARLRGFLGSLWPTPELSEAEQFALAAEIHEKGQTGGRRWMAGVSTKEIGFFVGAVTVLLIIGWAARVMSSEQSGSVADLSSIPPTEQAQARPSASPPTPKTDRPAPLPNTGRTNQRTYHHHFYFDVPGIPQDRSLAMTTTITSTLPGGIPFSASALESSSTLALSTVLHYWGWTEDPTSTLADLYDSSGSLPLAMDRYVNSQTDLRAVWRQGGSLQVLAKLIAAGYPVITQNGIYSSDLYGWYGQFEVVNGYDLGRHTLSILDASNPAGMLTQVSLHHFFDNWQAFNYSYLVIFPSADEVDVLGLVQATTALSPGASSPTPAPTPAAPPYSPLGTFLNLGPESYSTLPEAPYNPRPPQGGIPGMQVPLIFFLKQH